MALDGIFLRHLCTEISENLTGTRIDKIYQPNRDELVFTVRGYGTSHKLLLSARADSPRIGFIKYQIENPAVPPMFCMLLRKKLTGAKFISCTQPSFERMLRLKFIGINELGDETELNIIIEIMGKYSNIILTDKEDVIIESIHRVDGSMSGVRLVLPGVKYQMPPAQNKLDITANTVEQCVSAVCALGGRLDKAILNALMGFSPLVCREIAENVLSGENNAADSLTEVQTQRLYRIIGIIKSTAQYSSGNPYLIADKSGKPIDFSFVPIKQYGDLAKISIADSFSALLEAFYKQKDSCDRMHAKAQDLLRILANASERIARRVNAQTAELEQTANREQYKIMGDLLSTYMYLITPGSTYIEVQNYYSETGETVKIPLEPMLSPSQNIQKYYKEYRKAQTAEQILTEQIQKGKEELQYIDSVFDCLSRAENESELAEIRQELAQTGYIKHYVTQKKQPTTSPPQSFTSPEGFEVLVGKNNRQNDRVTTKIAKNYDIWFHARNIPGAHVVIITAGKTPGEQTLEFAAKLAAKHSKAGNAQTPTAVDYTLIKYVHKPAGAKPGMVIYDNFKTVYIKPAE